MLRKDAQWQKKTIDGFLDPIICKLIEIWPSKFIA